MTNIDILVISNNHSARATYTGALTGYGFRVTDTPSFTEAQALLNTEAAPESILIDLKFSASKAGAFIDYIRRSIGRDDIRIVVIGGNRDEEQAASANAFTPVDLDSLVQRFSMTNKMKL
jgi:CheY-like chemotaxis protein